jgi:hypothetical protein
MSLNAKQARFLSKIAKLIVWANGQGIQLIGAELFRTPEQAAINAEKGVGIKNSVHRKKLALDMYIYKNNTILWSGPEYEKLGRKWETMAIDARWGGDFRRRDVYHFSFMHNGVM